MPVEVDVCVQKNFIGINLPYSLRQRSIPQSKEEKYKYALVMNIFMFHVSSERSLSTCFVFNPLRAYESAKEKKTGIRVRLIDEPFRCYFYPFEKLEEFAEDFNLGELLAKKQK